MPSTTMRFSVATLVFVLGAASLVGAGKLDPAKLPQPKADYKPEQVVQLVMDALQANDADDSGIATAFNFASPDNKEATGPLEHFIPMVKTPAYKPLLNCKEVVCGKIHIEQDQAAQLVTITDAGGNKHLYIFHLSKQADGQLKGCWMTDAVVHVDPAEKDRKDV